MVRADPTLVLQHHHKTPLMLAAEYGTPKMVAELVACGARPHDTDDVSS